MAGGMKRILFQNLLFTKHPGLLSIRNKVIIGHRIENIEDPSRVVSTVLH